MPLVGALLLVVAACGSNDDDLGPAEFDTGVSIAEALDMPAGETATVNGWLAEAVSRDEARLCTELERPEPYLIECVEPSIAVLVRMDRYPGAKESQGSTWVDEPVQLSGKLVQLEGRAVDLDPYDCLDNFSSERCRLPVWWINPGAAGDAAAEAFTIQLIDLEPGNPEAVNVRTVQGQLTALADGVPCATVDASEAVPPALLIGLPDQPEACRREGSTVTLTNIDGWQLFETFVLTHGGRAELFNYAPVPVQTGPGTTDRQVLIPPAAGTSTATFRGIPVPFRMAIVDFFGAEQVATDEAEIEAAVPWPIVLPSYLPSGYEQIGLLRVDVPEDGLPPDAEARRIRVHIGFASGPQGPGFMYILSGGHVGTDGAEAATVNGQPAEYSVNVVGAQNLAWDLCGRTLTLGADADLSKDELVRIAESVPEQCE